MEGLRLGKKPRGKAPGAARRGHHCIARKPGRFEQSSQRNDFSHEILSRANHQRHIHASFPMKNSKPATRCAAGGVSTRRFPVTSERISSHCEAADRAQVISEATSRSEADAAL